MKLVIFSSGSKLGPPDDFGGLTIGHKGGQARHSGAQFGMKICSVLFLAAPLVLLALLGPGWGGAGGPASNPGPPHSCAAAGVPGGAAAAAAASLSASSHFCLSIFFFFLSLS